MHVACRIYAKCVSIAGMSRHTGSTLYYKLCITSSIKFILSHVEAIDYMQVTWLRKRFREVPSGSPAEKRVKFQTIHQSLASINEVQFKDSFSQSLASINEVQFKDSFRDSEQRLSIINPSQRGKEQSSACGWHRRSHE